MILYSSIYYCLIVVNPENPVCQEIKEIKKEFKLRHRDYGGSGSKAHITLNREFLDGKELKKLITSLRESLSVYYTFDLHLNDYSFFFESNIFFIDVAESKTLVNLQQLVTANLKVIKPVFRSKPYRFLPHMTIGRSLHHNQFREAYYEFERKLFSKTFRVRDIAVLYRQVGDSNYQDVYLPLKNEDWAVVY